MDPQVKRSQPHSAAEDCVERRVVGQRVGQDTQLHTAHREVSVDECSKHLDGEVGLVGRRLEVGHMAVAQVAKDQGAVGGSRLGSCH